jgi:carboxylesterase
VIHGFSGSPFEVRPLADELAARGLHVLGPSLAGHAEGDPRQLDATTWPDWVATPRRAVTAQRLRHGRVVVVGFSMGGLCALHLAAEAPETIACLGVLGVPLWLPQPVSVGLRTAGRLISRLGRLPGGRHLATRLPMVPKKAGLSDLRDPAMRAANPTMPAMPLRALAQLVQLASHVRSELPLVTCPTFIAHGAQDHTAPPACADELEERLGASIVERLRLPESYHLIPLDVERARLATALGDFVVRLL